jgi:hypothetical protein
VRNALAACTVAALCFGGFASASGTRPALKLLSIHPATVRGLNFQSAERVRVYLVGTQPEMMRVRAATTGTFKAAFADTAFDRCTAFAVRAVGSLGSRALLRFNPECAPA